MIDFHCHIDLYPNPVQIVEGCRQRGISVLSVTTTPRAWHGTKLLTMKASNIKTALGLHPQLAHERKDEVALFDRLLSETAFVGEIGLDGSPEFKPFWKDQLTVFSHILNSCQRAGGRLLSIHSRRAADDVLDYLAAYSGAGIPILHWFSGSFNEQDRAIQQGCWFSVGPAMLRHAKGRSLVARMPQNKVITETDGPFTQNEGRSLFPWDVSAAVNELAVIWRIPQDEVCAIVDANLNRLLGNVPKATGV
ncbi:MAG: Qat anti-phage system TatD family nuclease QatD [Armatimonadota bacterium]